MFGGMRKASALILLLYLCLPRTLWALEVPGPLVEPQWLASHLDAVVVLDVRENPQTFSAQGHVPGAVAVDWDKLQSVRKEAGVALAGMVPRAAAFQALMRGRGVNRNSAVVISSPGRTKLQATEMARLYWTLKYFGHDNVALLNGGTAAWSAAGHALAFDTSAVRQGDFTAGEPRSTIRATTAEVASAVQTGAVQRVDIRPLGYYLGVYKASYVKQSGHIPGAKLYPYDLAITAGPSRFRSGQELRALAGAFRITLDQPTIVYCNTGVLSAAGWFILHELLGNSAVRLYDGSMLAWTKTDHHAVERMTLNLN